MLALYIRSTCPFSQRVMQVAENLNVALDLKDIDEDDTARAELEEKGGKLQVPFLVDIERKTAMYESADIIDYLRENYANTGKAVTATKPRVHVGGSTCTSCEG